MQLSLRDIAELATGVLAWIPKIADKAAEACDELVQEHNQKKWEIRSSDEDK